MSFIQLFLPAAACLLFSIPSLFCKLQSPLRWAAGGAAAVDVLPALLTEHGAASMLVALSLSTIGVACAYSINPAGAKKAVQELRPGFEGALAPGVQIPLTRSFSTCSESKETIDRGSAHSPQTAGTPAALPVCAPSSNAFRCEQLL